MPVLDKWRQKRFTLVYFIPFLLYCLLIFWLSSQSDPGHLSPFAVPDKIAHILEYSGFGFLLMRMLTFINPEQNIVRQLIWVLSGALLYGLSDEIHQYFVPGREFSWMDLLADGAGGYLGARLWMIFKGKRVS
ncbi:MAG: VanZ family protein [Deltaproteobacteria bacterium]|nr:VanZ family protein [Candidatus Tharpella aukensis]